MVRATRVARIVCISSSTAAIDAGRALERALLAHQVDRFFVEAHAAERFALGLSVSFTTRAASASVLARLAATATPFTIAWYAVLQARRRSSAATACDSSAAIARAVWLSPFSPFFAAASSAGLRLDRCVHRDVAGVAAGEEAC